MLVTLNCSKTLIVLLACLTFVGQAMASTMMSYQMLSMLSMSSHSQDMPMMDHSNHNMSGNSSDNSFGMDESAENNFEDCCSTICKCYMGGCSNVATFMNNFNHNLMIVNPTKILNYSRVAISQQPSSLYRPPILS